MILLIFCGDLKYCPYINRYIERLELLKKEYKVIFWNRSNEKVKLSSKYIYYNKTSNLSKNKIGKISDFISFRKWLYYYIIDNKPEKCIILSTLTGILLFDLLQEIKIPYIFDIRDYSYENIKFFYRREAELIEHSYFTAISSKGFLEFLPNSTKYIIAHNFNRKDIDFNYRFKTKSNPINIVWNGVIRFFEYQKFYIDSIKNDKRFKMTFHGDGPELSIFKRYCNNAKINNIFFTGTYQNENKKDLLMQASILNNCYGYKKNPSNKLKYAISNRFYDGLIFHIPQIVEECGYKSKLVNNLNVGLNISRTTKLADELYRYYMSIEEKKFDERCTNALNQIILEDDEYINNIDKFIVF